MFDDLHSLVPVDSGGIMLTYKCSNRCRHCLYCSSPAWEEWIDLTDVSRIFEGLARTSQNMRGFHIAGGEPFLDFDLLLSVMRLSCEFGIPIEYVETNASWCTDLSVVRERFEKLQSLGLKCILVSCSPFHTEFIPLSRVAVAVKIGSEVFGPGGIVLWVPEFYRQISKMGTEKPFRLDEYVLAVGEINARRMIRSGYSLISGGRVGYELAGFYERRPPECCESDHCHMELLKSGHAHFDPYGNFIPSFCSGISLGDASDLPSLMVDLDLDRLPLVRMLAEYGPYGLYEFAVREFGYEPLEEGYVGKCHLCVDIRRWIKTRTDKYSELAPAKFYEELIKARPTRGQCPG
jgi:hypothetical protein